MVAVPVAEVYEIGGVRGSSSSMQGIPSKKTWLVVASRQQKPPAPFSAGSNEAVLQSGVTAISQSHSRE